MGSGVKPFRLLCRCLSGALGNTLEQSDLPANDTEWANVLRLSSAHLATPLLRWALREQGLFSDLPADVAEFLDAIYTLNLERNEQCADQLAHLIQALNAIGVKPVLLKGSAAFAGGLYPTLGERMVSDIDVLIPAARLPEILAKLTALGYDRFYTGGEELPNPQGFGTETHHYHYPMILSRDWPVGVELHVHPVKQGFVKLLCTEEVYKDAVPLSWRGGECLLPSPTHFILHNVIHSYLVDTKLRFFTVSLRHLFELVHASRTYNQQIDWLEIKDRFDQTAYGSALSEYMLLATTCLDFQTPPAIPIDDRAHLRIKPYLFQLNLTNRAVEWLIDVVRGLWFRTRSLLAKPKKSLQKLLRNDWYSRLYRDLRW